MPFNTCSVFIYLQLLTLLKSIIEIKKQQQKEDQYARFDPKMALFVCNRWDLVKEQDKEIVRQNALKRLGECWPQLDNSQVLFASSQAWANHLEVDEAYIADTFCQFLESIRDMAINTLNERTRKAYK
jgi:hypothetical protein